MENTWEKMTSSDLMTFTEGDMNISKKWINNPEGYGEFV